MFCTKRARPAPAGSPGAAGPRPVVAAFTATGTVTWVTSAALEIRLEPTRGNRRAARAATMTVTVPTTARTTFDGLPAALDLVRPGDHVTVQGLCSAAGRAATAVRVSWPATSGH